MQTRWTSRALRHLKEIHQYVAEENESAAISQISKILESIQALSQFPQMGRNGRVAGTRELVIPSTSYVVAYDVRDDAVRIIAIHHGAQNWPRSF